MEGNLAERVARRIRLFERAFDRGTAVDLLAEVHSVRNFIQSDPRLAALFGDLLGEGADTLANLRREDNALVEELVEVRRSLAVKFPEVDDSNRSPPGPDQYDSSYAVSLAYFDRVVGSGPDLKIPLRPRDVEDDTKSKVLIGILRSKREQIRSEKLQAGDWLDTHLWNLDERRRHLFNEWVLAARTAPGFAAHRLEGIARYLNPAPALRGEDESPMSLVTKAVLGSNLFHGLGDLRDKLYSEPLSGVEGTENARAKYIIQSAVEPVLDTLHARIGSARSHRALVERFRLRAELYDHAQLRALAESSSRPEDALVDRLAGFLFDQGLNPITTPLVGRVSPDLLDRSGGWTFYVEAKQYVDSKHGKETIVKGMPQVWDTLSRLQGHPHQVREAFYVVFRRGGPRYVLPEELRSEGVVVYPVLVDIAPPEESGRRQRHRPIAIPERDLLPEVPEQESGRA